MELAAGEQRDKGCVHLARFVIDEASYGDAMHVVDVCRGAGVKTLGIMTK